MALDASQVMQQGRSFVLGLSARQRVLIALSLIAVVGTLWVFVSLLGRGDFKVLYSGLDPAEANTIAKRLAQENIPAQISSDGKTLSVPDSRLDKARLDMAAEGFPQSGRLGFEIFDQPNWGQSDFAEQVNYQRALEGELERTIQDLTDVEAVRVNLVLPHDSLFTEQQRQAKASVLVKLRNGRLSDRSLRAITYLVASAVDTLSPDNVTVIDANGNVPIVLRGGVKPGSPEGAGEYEQALDQKLTATLTPILGADHFVAKATVEYDQASSENTQETYDPKDSVVLTSQMTSDGGDDGTSAAGVPGAASNVPQDQSGNANSPNNTTNPPNPNNASSNSSNSQNAAPATSDGSGNDGSGVTSSSKTFAVGRTVEHTVRPPGTIRRITAAILVDNGTQTQTVNGKKTEVAVARTPAELKQIQDLASAVLGLDTARGDVVTVENMPFQITPVQTSGPLSGIQKFAPLVNEYGYLFRYFILGLLGVLIFLFVIQPLMKQLVAMPRERAGTEGGGSIGAGSAAPGMGLPGSAQALASANGAPLEQIEPVNSRQRTALLKEALATKVTKTPAEAGRLIEGWLREEEQ
ncbi:MAG TPA: flagellar basal-body MS-ring/collar protein FliF [Terriglobia bacterium]|nr:flagellar basal-body MS-ring/collar protein FliF [Terriglobia bacterium]